MRRIRLILAVAAIVAAMTLGSAMPAFAQEEGLVQRVAATLDGLLAGSSGADGSQDSAAQEPAAAQEPIIIQIPGPQQSQ